MNKQLIDKLIHSRDYGGVIARGAVGAFLVRLAGVGVLFGLHTFLARLLGFQQYGIYVYVISWVNLLLVLCLLGSNTSLVRFVSEYQVQARWGLLRGILKRTSQALFVFSIFVGLAGCLVVWFLTGQAGGELAVCFYLGFASLPLMALCRQWEAVLRALKRVVHSVLLDQVIRPLFMAGTVFFIYFIVNGSVTAFEVMGSHLLSAFLTLLTALLIGRRFLPRAVLNTEPAYHHRLWLKVSLPLLLIAGMSILLNRTDVIMLGIMKGAGDAGIYSAGIRISNMVSFGLLAMNSILGPIISELYHTGQQQRLQRILRSAALGVFVFTVLFNGVLIIIGNYLLGLFGQDFTRAFVPLLILLGGQTANALAGPVGLLLSMSGRQNVMSVIVSVSAVCNIGLNLLLIPSFGMTGAAVATALTMLLWNTAMLLYVYMKLDLNPTCIGIRKNA